MYITFFTLVVNGIMKAYYKFIKVLLFTLGCLLIPVESFSEDLYVWKGESIELMCPIPPHKHSNSTVYSQFYEWQKCPDGIDLIQVGGTRHVKITINKFFTDTRTVACKVKWFEKIGSQQFGPFEATYRWNVTYYKVSAIPTQDSYTIKVGDLQQIGYEVTPRPSNPEAFVSFVSTAPDIASVDNNGYVKGITPGSCEIILKTNYNVEYSCKIVVNPIELEAIVLNENNIILHPNEKFKLLATFHPTNCTDKVLKFTSSDDKVVEVSEQGVISAKSIGNATITATSTNWITDYCNVVVNPIPVSQIELESSNINMLVGDSIKINASLIPDNCTNKDLQYQISNPDVAVINDDGIIKAIKKGTAFISVFIDDVASRAVLTIREHEQDKYKINLLDYSAVKVNEKHQTILNQNYTILVAAHSDYYLTAENDSDSWATFFSENITDGDINLGVSEIKLEDIMSDNNIYIIHKYLHDMFEYDIALGIDQIIDDDFYYISNNNVLEFKNLPNDNMISLYDLSGKVIYRNSQSTAYKSFAIPGKGVFIIEVKTPSNIKAYKLKF